MTRTDILTVSLVGITAGGAYWWANRQPVEAPRVAKTTTGESYTGHGGWTTTHTVPDLTDSTLASGTDLTFGTDNESPYVWIKTPAPGALSMMILGDPIVLEIQGRPVAWIYSTGGPNGKPRVRIRDGRVADTVRALALMAIKQPAGATNDPMVAEWVRRLEK